MNLNARIEALVELGKYLNEKHERLQALVRTSYLQNRWFTEENIYMAMDAIIENYLQRDKIDQWLSDYDIPETARSINVGMVMAGNIPLVGFHDLICVFLAGYRSRIKLSEKDKTLIPHFIEIMDQKHPGISDYFEIVERLENFDAVIATGSNNSARYFEAYFGKYPNIIRKKPQRCCCSEW